MTLFDDIRYATRQMLAQRGTTVAAILTLALGIGANMSVFGVINAMLFKPAPGTNPHELVWVSPKWVDGERIGYWSYPNYRAFAAEARSYTGVLTTTGREMSLGGTAPERVSTQLVSANYFDVLGVRPAIGLTFSPAADSAGPNAMTAVLSHAYWTRHFSGDSTIIGTRVLLNSQSVTIAGVAPRGFMGIELGDDPDFWVPIAAFGDLFGRERGMLSAAGAGWLRVVGRLRSGVSKEQAQSEAAVLATRENISYVEREQRKTLVVSSINGGLDPGNRAQAAPVLSLVMVVPLLVLVVACANVANLFVARSLRRRKEFAVRRALGGTRLRLARQMITECVLLAIVAGGAGVVLSSWLTALIAGIGALPAEITPALTPDVRVFVATFALALLAGLLFGLVPAFAATRESLTPALRNETMALRAGGRRHLLRNIFVTGQVAVSLLLLITGGLFVRSLTKALDVSPGFDPRNTVTLSYDLRDQGYSDEQIEVFNRRLLATLSASPGVEAAALANVLPLSSRSYGTEITKEGAPAREGSVPAQLSTVTPGFFDALRVPFVKGRPFSDADARGTARVVVVNQTLADRFWPGQDPIGKRFRIGDEGSPLIEVIGVVAAGKYRSLAETRPASYFFLPASQNDPGSDISLVVRSSVSAHAAMEIATRTVRELDANLPFFRVQTMEETIAGTVDGQRAGAAMLGVFGALALLLASLGLYAVIAHGVATRTREIGIRMSLGARAIDVVSAFTREGLRLTLIGGAVGVALSIAVSQLLGSLLFGLSATDALTFAYASGILMTVAFVASVVPARRAARVHPLVALRAE